jgi:hypothetical protein
MFCRSFFVGGYGKDAIHIQTILFVSKAAWVWQDAIPSSYPRNLIVCKLRGWQGCHTYTNYIICI